jgi:hypothetical protein
MKNNLNIQSLSISSISFKIYITTLNSSFCLEQFVLYKRLSFIAKINNFENLFFFVEVVICWGQKKISHLDLRKTSLAFISFHLRACYFSLLKGHFWYHKFLFSPTFIQTRQQSTMKSLAKFPFKLICSHKLALENIKLQSKVIYLIHNFYFWLMYVIEPSFIIH